MFRTTFFTLLLPELSPMLSQVLQTRRPEERRQPSGHIRPSHRKDPRTVVGPPEQEYISRIFHILSSLYERVSL